MVKKWKRLSQLFYRTESTYMVNQFLFTVEVDIIDFFVYDKLASKKIKMVSIFSEEMQNLEQK